MATTHLDHLSESVRQQQASAIVQAIDDFGSGDEPVILVGDFNENPSGPTHEALELAGFQDIWQRLNPSDSGRTFPSSNPSSRIDYVWWRPGPSSLTSQLIVRILTQPVQGIYGSDHLGLRCDMRD